MDRVLAIELVVNVARLAVECGPEPQLRIDENNRMPSQVRLADTKRASWLPITGGRMLACLVRTARSSGHLQWVGSDAGGFPSDTVIVSTEGEGRNRQKPDDIT